MVSVAKFMTIELLMFNSRQTHRIVVPMGEIPCEFKSHPSPLFMGTVRCTRLISGNSGFDSCSPYL